MTISELGELALIDKIKRLFQTKIPRGVIGIGDDCAVIPMNENESYIVTTDALIEHVHFTHETMNPEDLGYKSLIVNLSDIAAMGGKPKFVFLSLALPASTSVTWIDSFLNEFKKMSDLLDVYLLGGNTTRSLHSLMISVTVLGQIENQFLKRRSDARPGDIICVNSFLGDSAAGLKSIQEGIAKTSEVLWLQHQHRRPKNFTREGLWLGERPCVHAMMDLSDGLHTDLKHILRSSRCGAEVDLDRIPLSDALREIGFLNSWNAEEIGVYGGEDYSLLFTVDSQEWAQLKDDYHKCFHSPLYPIGRITDEKSGLNFLRNGEVIALKGRGFAHF